MKHNPSNEQITIAVCGVGELPAYMPRATHLISIYSPGARNELPVFSFAPERILELNFDDIGEARAIDHSPYGVQYPPRRKDIQEAVEFVRKIKSPAHLLIHCQAGISRSTAVALIALVVIRGKDARPSSWINELLSIRKEPYPNKLILRYGDEILDLKGKLVRVGKKIQSLTDKLWVR